MLRYKIYTVVTHPKFPIFGFYLSLVLFWVAFYVLLTPSLVAIPAFISENALPPSYQTSQIDAYTTSSSLKDFTNFEGSSIYYTYFRSKRTTGKDCMALLFAYNSSKIGVQLAISLKRYMESQSWGGDLLIVLYKPEPYSKAFRKWLDWSKGRFGVIRIFFEFEIDSSMSYLSISGDGINGIQTDVDQLFAVIELIRKVPVDFKYPLPSYSPIKSVSGSMSSLKSLLMGNLHSPSAYALNSGYLSLKIFSVSTSKSSPTNTSAMLKLIELIVRTFTSLDENLHAGFYFYYFTSPSLMMPLSKFSYIVGTFVMPLIFQSMLILKEKWWDLHSMLLLATPYFTGYLSYVIISFDLGNYPEIIFAVNMAFNALGYGGGKIFKAYSNFALGISIAIMSIRNIPIGLLICTLIPFKVLLPPFRSHIFFFTLFAVFMVGMFYFPINFLIEIEKQSGYFVLFYYLCIINPVIWHLLYTFV